MEMAVDTAELHAAARACDDAAEATAALAAALAREAAAAGAWSSGLLADVADRFFTTLAWAATTGGEELGQLARRLDAAAGGYDAAELALAARTGAPAEGP